MNFLNRLGYLPFDVARPLRLPALRESLAQRILEETDVLRMIALEGTPRNKAILMTLYGGGFRVAETCSLKWSDLQSRDQAGQITVFGKGAKTRTVLMPLSVWNALLPLRQDAGDDQPVFRSRKGLADRPQSGEACRDREEGVLPLAEARPRLARPRPWRTDPSRTGHPGAFFDLDHRQISPRTPHGFER